MAETLYVTLEEYMRIIEEKNKIPPIVLEDRCGLIRCVDDTAALLKVIGSIIEFEIILCHHEIVVVDNVVNRTSYSNEHLCSTL